MTTKTTALRSNRRPYGRVAIAVTVMSILWVTLALQIFPSEVSAQSSSTAPQEKIADVRFGDHGSFERAVLDIDTSETAPGSAPSFSWSYREGDRVVRVNLPTVGATTKTDGPGLGKAISKYYAVRAPGTTRNLFVDFHLKGAAKAVKVYKLDNPARIVVDVTPGGKALFPRPANAPGAVVIGPRADNMVGPGSFMVRGYARPFEAVGAWRIKDGNGRVVRQGNYRTNDYAETWGSYRFSASYPASMSGKSGILEVGEFSARDGAFRGASVPLRFK